MECDKSADALAQVNPEQVTNFDPGFSGMLKNAFCTMTDDVLCIHQDWSSIFGSAHGNSFESLGLISGWFSGFGQWAGALATMFGFYFLWKQIRREKQVLETQTTWTMYETSISVLTLFVEYPDLRKYFYDQEVLPDDEDECSKVLAAAEVIADHLENIVNSGETGAIDPDTYYVWVKYIFLMGLRSHVMRDFLSDEPIKGIARSEQIGEGLRYDENFKNILLHGIVPEACRIPWEQECAKAEENKKANKPFNQLVNRLKAPSSAAKGELSTPIGLYHSYVESVSKSWRGLPNSPLDLLFFPLQVATCVLKAVSLLAVWIVWLPCFALLFVLKRKI